MMGFQFKQGRRYLLVVAALFAILLGACNKHEVLGTNNSVVGLQEAIRQPQPYKGLAFYELEKVWSYEDASNEYREPMDADSVEMTIYCGDTLYHPVQLIHRCFTFIGTYYVSRDVKHLRRAENYALKLMSLAHVRDSAAYLPYNMRFAVHGDSANTLEVPFFSAMAQGEFLMVLMRLYEFTGNKDYLMYGHQVFHSFLLLQSDFEDWVVRLDSAGYYWMEEYPHETRPGMTLNGYVYALFGIYEYRRFVDDPRAELIYDLSLTTLKHYLPYYRQPGKSSLYCLGHKARAGSYHAQHIKQMNVLYAATGDPFFEIMALAFEADSNGEDPGE